MKRVADTQLTKDSMPDEEQSLGTGGPPRATAAQMASRRLAKPRGGRRALGARPTGSPLPASTQQSQQAFSLSNGSSGQGGGFLFGQQGNSAAQNQTSASFPPFGGSSNSSFTPPSSAFSFNTPPAGSVNNPFTAIQSGTSTNLPKTGGFQGSIFKVDAPLSRFQRQEQAAQKPAFLPGGPTVNGHTNGSTPNQTETQANPFPSTMSQQQTTQDSYNMFRQQSPAGESKQNGSGSAAPANPQTPHTQNSSSLFANPQQPQTFQPTSSLFSNFSQPPQASSNMFLQTPSNSSQTHTNPFTISNDDVMMRTSPDNSPQSAQQQQSQPGLFSHMNQPPAQTQSTPTTSADNPASPGSLFERISRPEPDAGSQQIINNPSTQPTSGGLFGRISAPESNPTNAAMSTNGDTSATGPSQRNATNENRKIAQPTLFQAPSQDKPAHPNPFTSLKTPAPATPPATPSLFSTVFTGAPKNIESVQQSTSSENGNNDLFFKIPPPTPQNASQTSSTPNDAIPKGGNSAKFSPLPPNKMNFASPNTPLDLDQSIGEDLHHGIPPDAPEHFTEVEKRQTVTGYRLKGLDVGVRRQVVKRPDSHNMGLLRNFYGVRHQAILDANGGPLESLAGRKRKSREEGQSSEHGTKKAKPTTPGWVFNNGHAMKPNASDTHTKPTRPLQQLTDTNSKRKADEDLVRDNMLGSSEGNKRARGSESTQFSSSSPNSQTSSIFKNILGLEKQASSEQSTAPADRVQTGSQAASTPTNNFFQFKPTQPKDGSGSGTPSMASLTSKGTETSTSKPSMFGNAQASKSNHSSPDSSATSAFKPQMSSNTPYSVISPSKTQSIPQASPDKSKVPTFNIPMFSTGAPTNFLSQFGQAAKKTEEEEKKKRKAEDYDSEEEDEASWERRYEEEQRAKKQKIMEEAQAAQASKGFVLNATGKQSSEQQKADKSDKATGPSNDDDGLFVPQVQSTESSLSVFDKAHPSHGAPNPHHNIFGHLSDIDSGAAGSKADDADDDYDEDGEAEEPPPNKNMFTAFSSTPTNRAASASQPPGRSLFDRIQKPEEPSSKSDIFSQSTSTGQSSFAGFKPVTEEDLAGLKPKGNQTWKADSPIRFSPQGPAVNVTSPSPSKVRLNGLFGQASITAETPKQPTSSIFSTPTATPGASFGFAFSPSSANTATGSLAPPSNVASNVTSRATSPGFTTGESANESNAEGVDQDAQKDQQLDLTAPGPGEENEDVLFQAPAKGSVYDGVSKKWNTKGQGQLRVLQDRDTKKARILLRLSPSGRVAMNTALFNEGKYSAAGTNVVRVPILADGKLQMWVFKVGGAEDAKNLLETLQENKKN